VWPRDENMRQLLDVSSAEQRRKHRAFIARGRNMSDPGPKPARRTYAPRRPTSCGPGRKIPAADSALSPLGSSARYAAGAIRETRSGTAVGFSHGPRETYSVRTFYVEEEYVIASGGVLQQLRQQRRDRRVELRQLRRETVKERELLWREAKAKAASQRLAFGRPGKKAGWENGGMSGMPTWWDVETKWRAMPEVLGTENLGGLGAPGPRNSLKPVAIRASGPSAPWLAYMATIKVKFPGLNQNLQVDPAV
jgi:hypothetical protein